MTDILLGILFFIVGVTAVTLLWVMLYDSTHFRKSEYTFRDARIAKKVRAVVISDLHCKQYGRDNELLLESVRESKPDIILIPGDLLTAKPKAKFTAAVKLLEELAKDYPIYYSDGNHEFRMKLYKDVYGDMGERYAGELERLKVSPINNDSRAVEGANIRVYGLQIDAKYYKRRSRVDMADTYMTELLGERDPKEYNVVLAHDPEYFDTYAKWQPDLVISGHVHGGVARVPFIGKGVISPRLTLFPRYDGGLFTEGSAKMLLSRGLGMHTIPLRLFNPGDLIVIDLEPEK